MAWVVYDAFHTRTYGTGTKVDFDADTFKVLILTAAYTPDRAADAFVDDLGATEVTGTGYTAGGLDPGAITVSTTANVLTIDCPDIAIAQSGAGFTDGRYLALAKILGGASSADPLIAYYDLGTDRGNVNGALNLNTPNGLLKTVA